MKKFISLLAVICLLCSVVTLSFADNTQNMEVFLSAPAGTFSVTVPESLNVSNSESGTYTIKNTGDVPVKVNAISIRPENSWARINSDQAFSAYSQFKMDISGTDSVIQPKSDGNFGYTVAIPENQPIAINNQKIATVTFTIAVDDTFPSTPFVPTEPTAVSPTLVLYQYTEYYIIARLGDYSLLLNSTLTDNYPAGSSPVYADTSKELSVPTENGSAMFFELSSAEFEKYCKNVLPDDNIGVYYLRDNKIVVGNTISDEEPYSYMHRYAIWVPNSSLRIA